KERRQKVHTGGKYRLAIHRLSSLEKECYASRSRPTVQLQSVSPWRGGLHRSSTYSRQTNRLGSLRAANGSARSSKTQTCHTSGRHCQWGELFKPRQQA